MFSTSFGNSVKFSSIRTRLIVFILVMLLPVLTGIYWFVSAENQTYTDQTINTYLKIGSDVFDFSREEHKDTLLTISSALTRDWGFRNAFGAADRDTIMDAAQTLLTRSFGAADVMLITDMSGRVIIDTSDQGFDELPEPWIAMLDVAMDHPDGFADSILTIRDVPYQLTVIPLFLPMPVAWIFAGFPLDDEFALNIKATTASDVSILRYSRSADGERDAAIRKEVIASTLRSEDALLLQQSLDPMIYSQTQRITLSDADYGTLVRSLAGSHESAEEIVAVIQRSYLENEANLAVLRDRLFEFSLAIVCISLIGVVLLARGFTQPVLSLSRRVRRIEQGDYSPATIDERVSGRDEVAELAQSIDVMASGLAEKEKVRDLLGKVVSHEIAEELLSRQIELGGEEKIVTVLFADIHGFTSLSETQTPSQTLQMLNTCLEQICHAIESNGGVVDKFTGDAVMALFGAPVTHTDDAARAASAVLAIQQAMATLNEKAGGHSLGIGVGLHTGLVVAGNMGSRNRMNYTVIGDAVNLASRLEGLTRYYQVENVVSEATRDAMGGQSGLYVWRELDIVRVKGKQQAVKIFELLGARTDLEAALLHEIDDFNQALSHYRNRQWAPALDILHRLHSGSPCTLYSVYIDRIGQIRDRADENWDAVHVFDTK